MSKVTIIDKDSEWKKCRGSVIYFAQEYVQIFSSEEDQWISMDLWPFQIDLLRQLSVENRIVLLKARQLGFTTIVLVYLLWRFVFYPAASVGLFSRGDVEAMELLERLVKMYQKLPDWMQAERIVVDNAHHFEVSNGSWARAMSTKKGESFTFKYLFWDELDRHDNADKLVKNTKPAADAAGAQIIAGSISDKDKSDSVFKNTFIAAEEGENMWFPVFLPWHRRPGRDKQWYRDIVKDAIARAGGDIAGAMDEVFQQYPGEPEDALSPRKQGKRIPYVHLKRVYDKRDPIRYFDGPAVPDLRVYVTPDTEIRCPTCKFFQKKDPKATKHECTHCKAIIKAKDFNELPVKYVIGADPAEGVEGGDDSALRILNRHTGEEVAACDGKFEPKKDFPLYLFNLATWYKNAGILVERNNHGHAVLGELAELIAKDTSRVEILLDPNDGREGWLTSPSGTGKTRGKAYMYDIGASAVKDMLVALHDRKTVTQLASIDIKTLNAPDGEDHGADAFVLASLARTIPGRTIEGKVFF